jgi:hypothetical protein
MKLEDGIWYGVNTGAPYAAYPLPDGKIKVVLLHPNTLEEIRNTGHVTPAMFSTNYVRRGEIK